MRALIAALVLVGGCYAPDPQSGAYLCGSNKTCPDGLSCECGQCVKKASEAACSFDITSSMATMKNRVLTLEIDEHKPFPISIQAYASDGSPATGFNGDVTVSSTWGDVCVGTAGCLQRPNKVQLAGGKGDATIRLNRETIPPQSALLRAEIADAVGTSAQLRITVNAAPFVRDIAPIVAPLALPPLGTAFGFATVAAAAPSVIKTIDGWRMYYIGGITKGGLGSGVRFGLGVATSSDGKTFTAGAQPLYEADGMSDTAVGEASAYDDGVLTHIFLGRQQRYIDASKTTGIGYETIAELTSANALGPFTLTPTPPVTQIGGTPDCPYCFSLDAPLVIKDPNPDLNGGGPKAAVMFFSAAQKSGTDSAATFSVAVVRAASADGASFVVDPAPILQTTSTEQIIFSPRVVIDGTVYKMYYSAAPLDVLNPNGALDPCSAPYHVNYATSSDGFFWVRSPTNATARAHVLDVAPAGNWDNSGGKLVSVGSVLVGSVLPADGVDPSTGLVLYYSPYSRVLTTCTPNGIGRAAQP